MFGSHLWRPMHKPREKRSEKNESDPEGMKASLNASNVQR